MDFESPDVAKEFPGLYMGDLEVSMKSDGGDYDEDLDKSKKKKDKKKDKDKGYAALAGESSHDEDDDSRSPGKSKKIKSFKLTSSKKKDKEKEKEPKSESHGHSVSSILRSGSIRERRPFDRDKKPSEKELKKSSQKDVKNEPSTSSQSSSANPRLSLPTPASVKVAHPAPERTNSLTKNLTLNAFLNAPAPKKKEAQKEEKVKKEKSKSKDETKKGKEVIMPSLARLKLKRGSKNSLDDSHSQTGDSTVAPSHQFPESPDAIAKEIRRYEVLLEQSHAQIKASKKVSKKSEEQLWELQRTLTQLKRKLRSVNALSSASSAHIVLSSVDKTDKKEEDPRPSSNTKPGPAAVVTTGSAPLPISKPNQDISTPAVTASISPQQSGTMSVIDATRNQKVEVKVGTSPESTLKSESMSPVLPPEVGKRLSVQIDTPTEEFGELQIEDKGQGGEASKSPGQTSLEKFQVQVQVHNSSMTVEREREILLTPEEFESFDTKTQVEPIRNCPSPIVMLHCSKTRSAALSVESGEEDKYSDGGSSRGFHTDDGEYVEIKKIPSTQQQPEETQQIHIPAFVVEERDEFDPFALPIFQTDEFIALENEALINFNQRIQDDIVREEDRINALTSEFKYLTEAGYRNSAMEDLETLDDDELAELWYSRKVENEELHEKVSCLRTRVISGILEEFRLETRLRYLQDRAEASPTQMLQTEV